MRFPVVCIVMAMLIAASAACAEVRKALPADMPAASNGQGPATPLDVIKMSKAGLSDSVIINKMDATGASYSLSVNDIIALKNEGVSDDVINYMINARNVPAARMAASIPKASPVTYVVPAAVVAPAPTYIVRDYYYDPPPISFSFGYSSGWGCGPGWRRGGWGWGGGYGYRRRCW